MTIKKSPFGFTVSPKTQMAILCYVDHLPDKEIRNKSGLATRIIADGCRIDYGITLKNRGSWSSCVTELANLGCLQSETRGKRRPWVAIGNISDDLRTAMDEWHKQNFIEVVAHPFRADRIVVEVEPAEEEPPVQAGGSEINYSELADTLLLRVTELLSSGGVSTPAEGDDVKEQLLESIDRYRQLADTRLEKLKKAEAEIKTLQEFNEKERQLRKAATERLRIAEENVQRLAKTRHVFDDKNTREIDKILRAAPQGR